MVRQIALLLVSFASAASAVAQNMDGTAELRKQTQELVTTGLKAARAGDADEAAAYLGEACRVSQHSIVCHLAAAAEAIRKEPGEAVRNAKRSSFSPSSTRYPEFAEAHAKILEWARPAVIGTDLDCQYRPRDTMSRCKIEEKGELERLIKKYFGIDYHLFWLNYDQSEAEAKEPCPFLLLGSKVPDLEPDTERRCTARRMFRFYVFPPPPAVTLPPPEFQIQW